MPSETTIVNVTKTDSYDEYLGRENRSYGLSESIHHNPYKLDNHTRQEAIDNFAVYFYHRLLTDETYFNQLYELKGETLACWCAPKDCHGDVIANFVENLEETDLPKDMYDHIREQLDDIDEDRLTEENEERLEKIATEVAKQ